MATLSEIKLDQIIETPYVRFLKCLHIDRPLVHEGSRNKLSDCLYDNVGDLVNHVDERK